MTLKMTTCNIVKTQSPHDQAPHHIFDMLAMREFGASFID